MTPFSTTIAFPSPWPAVFTGLVVDPHGRLQLAELPEWPALESDDPCPSPGGLAVHRGEAFFTGCEEWPLMVRDCAGGIAQFGVVSWGSGLSQVLDPGGLAASQSHHSLLVADRGNDRVQEFDLATAQLVWRWLGLGGVNDVVVGAEDRTYASATQGVVELRRGEPPRLHVSAKDLGGAPTALAVDSIEAESVFFVATNAVVAIDANGKAIDWLTEALAAAIAGNRDHGALAAPFQLAAGSGKLFVASAASATIRVVNAASGELLGDMPGESLPFTALAVEEGALWLSDGHEPVASETNSTVRTGTASIGPIPLFLDPGADHKLQIRAVGTTPPASTELSVGFSAATPDEVTLGPAGLIRIPENASELYVRIDLRRPSAAAVQQEVPVIDRVELDLDDPGWIAHLPAAYRAQGDPAAFLDPFLRLLQTGKGDVIDGLEDLPSQFDPSTATDDLDGDRWLDWLATWVDALLDEQWTGELRRQMVASAFERHGRRGTEAALIELIEAELGLRDISIHQPADETSVWVLGEAQLGMTTMTAAAPPNGSIVDVTATTGRSHLIGPGDYGAPLYGDVAHRFDVLVHAAHVRCEEDEAALRALIDREKPAHTTAHVCVVEPNLSVGIQSRIGVDAVVVDHAPIEIRGGIRDYESRRAGDRVELGDAPADIVLR